MTTENVVCVYNANFVTGDSRRNLTPYVNVSVTGIAHKTHKIISLPKFFSFGKFELRVYNVQTNH